MVLLGCGITIVWPVVASTPAVDVAATDDEARDANGEELWFVPNGQNLWGGFVWTFTFLDFTGSGFPASNIGWRIRRLAFINLNIKYINVNFVLNLLIN